MRRVTAITAAAIVLAVLFPVVSGLPGPGATPTPEAVPARAAMSPSESLANQGVRFEQNRGQFDPQVRFVSRGPGYTLFLTDTEAVFELPAPKADADAEQSQSHVVRMAFEEARPSPAIDTSLPLPGVSNYLTGNDPTKWVKRAPSFGRLVYRDLYPGIDLVFRANEDRQVEYDFIVAPGADPSAIRLGFSGQDAVSVADDGALVVATPAGEVRQHAPVVFQEAAGQRTSVAGAFSVTGDKVGFSLGSYDTGMPLVIDPVVTYSTYLGGATNDEATAVALDDQGSAYVTGSTCPSDFPLNGEVTPKRAQSGGCDAFVAKLTPDGSELVYFTYLGGSPPEPYRGTVEPAPTTCPLQESNQRFCHHARSRTYTHPDYVDHDHGVDVATAIAVDPAGRAFVTGYTYAGDFPTTRNAFDRTCGGISQRAAPPAGAKCEEYRHIKYRFRATQNITCCSAVSADPQATVNNYWVRDAFLSRLSGDGSGLEYSTYVGGAPKPEANGLTHEGPPGAHSGSYDTGPPIMASGTDMARAIAVDPQGNAYLTGATTSPGFPTTSNAFDRTSPAEDPTCGTSGSSSGVPPYEQTRAPYCHAWYTTDAFVTKLNTTVDVETAGHSLVYSTFLGGAGGGANDVGLGIGFAPGAAGAGHIYAAGTAVAGFPTTLGAFKTNYEHGGCSTPPSGYGSPANRADPCGAGFIVKVDPAASTGVESLVSSTRLNVQGLNALAIGPDGTPFVAGYVDKKPPASHYSGTPPGQTIGDVGGGGWADAFVAKFDPALSTLSFFAYVGGGKPDAATSIAVDYAGSAYVTGLTVSRDFPTNNGFHGFNAGPCGTLCDVADAFLFKLDPSGSALAFSTYVGGTGTDVARGVAIGSGEAFSRRVAVVGTTMSANFPTSDSAYQPKRVGAGEVFVTTIDMQSKAPRVNSLMPSRGPTSGGTEVTISGTGFTGAGEVLFGDQPAGILKVEDTKITVTSPAQPASSASVTVKGPGGDSATVGDWTLFTYDEGGWASAGSGLSGTATLLDHSDCHVSDPPPGFRYPCGKVLVVGAANALLFDPRTGMWSETASPGQVRINQTSSLLSDGRVLVIGGFTDNVGIKNSAELYEPNYGTWSATGDMAVGRVGHTATRLPDGRVIVAGGFTPDPRGGGRPDLALATVEVFEPDATGYTTTQTTEGPKLIATKGSWRPARPMAEARGFHTATVLTGPDCDDGTPHDKCGKVLVTGGRTSTDAAGTAIASAEIIDPAQEKSAPLAAGPAFARWRHTATPLPDGKVLLLGGGGAIAEIFDPAVADSLAWAFAGSMQADRNGHSAVLLPNGKVLVNGGATGSAELFEVATNTWRTAGIPRSAGVAVVLSGSADRFEANDSCRPRCGRALLAAAQASLYTPTASVTSLSPPSGDRVGGTELTFTGTGLERTAQVLFDGRPASDVREVTHHTQIAAKTPPMAGKIRPDVWVVNEGGPARVSIPFRYSGPPGAPGTIIARLLDADKLQLSFVAAGTVADANPPATAYQLRRSRSPIASTVSFEAADVLNCSRSTDSGDCLLEPSKVGEPLSVTINPPPAGRTRHYAVRAVNEDAVVGPFATVSYTSAGIAVEDDTLTTVPDTVVQDKCPATASPGNNQVAYPAGYSLVGLPSGTVVGANSPLYSWLDQGGGANYATSAASAPTEAGRGYWAWFACASVVELSVPGADSASLALGAYRASMVGNPSATGPASVSGHDFAARWDPSLNAGNGGYHVSGYRQAQELAVGEGMWVFSYVPTEVTIRRR